MSAILFAAGRPVVRSAFIPVLVVLLSAALHAAAQDGAPAADHLVLDDQGHLHGRFAGFDPKAGVLFRIPGAPTPFAVPVARMDELAFAPPKVLPAGPGAMEFRFANGDRLRGRLLACGPDRTEIEAVGLGKVAFPTRALAALAPAEEATILDGAGKAGDWKVYEGEAEDLKVADGILAVQGREKEGRYLSVGRRLPLPPRFRLDLRLARTGPAVIEDSALPFEFRIMADKAVSDDAGGYSVSIGTDSGTVSRVSGGSDKSFPVPSAKSRALSLWVDAGARTLAVSVEGQPVLALTESAPFPQGQFLLFPMLDAADGWQVSGLRLSAWNGLPSAPAEGKPEEDCVRLDGGDRLCGEFLGIRDGKLLFRASLGEMAFSADRIRSLVFACRRALPMAAAGAVQAEFGGGDRLTLVPEAVRDGVLSGRNAWLGPCALRQETIGRLRFNLDAPFRAAAEAVRQAKVKRLEEDARDMGVGDGQEPEAVDPEQEAGE